MPSTSQTSSTAKPISITSTPRSTRAARQPARYEGYAERRAWRLPEHQRRGTACIETTSHQLRSGRLFKVLAEAPASRGIQLDPNPDLPLPEGWRQDIGDLIDVEFITIHRSKDWKRTTWCCLAWCAEAFPMHALTTRCWRSRCPEATTFIYRRNGASSMSR